MKPTISKNQLEVHAMRLKNRLQHYCSTRAYRRLLYTIERTARKPEISKQDKEAIRNQARSELVSQSPDFPSDCKAFESACDVKKDHLSTKISNLTSSIKALAPSIEPGFSSLFIITKLLGVYCLTACLIVGESILARLLIEKSEIFEKFLKMPLLSQLATSSTLVLMALVYHVLYSAVCEKWKNTVFYLSLGALTVSVVVAIISFGFTFSPSKPLDVAAMAASGNFNDPELQTGGEHKISAIISGISLMLCAVFSAPILARYAAKQQACLKAMYPHKETARMNEDLLALEKDLESVLTAKSIVSQSLNSFETQCSHLEARVESALLTAHAENN